MFRYQQRGSIFFILISGCAVYTIACGRLCWLRYARWETLAKAWPTRGPGQRRKAAAAKYSLAALLQRFAVAIFRHSFQQMPHRLQAFHQVVKFPELLLGKLPPALGSACGVAKSEEQPPNVLQRKTELPRALNDRQAMEHGRIVASLASDARRLRKQPNLLVIANRGRPQPHLARNFGNRQGRHGRILKQRRGEG